MSSIFSKLDKKIQNLLSSSGIKKPTEPQIKAIKPILNGENVLLIAPTGLGKTEAALLPIFNIFLKKQKENENKGISILYITPLRALNRDMLKRTFEWGEQLGINIAVRHGDTSQTERTQQSKKPPDMLITTPETFQILFTGKRLRKSLSNVKWVVVDEIHEMAGDERGAQLAVGLERLFELTNINNISFQRIGLSATIGSPKNVALFLGGNKQGKFRNVKIIDVNATKHIDISVEIPFIKKGDYSQANKFSMEPISFASLRRSKEIIEQHVSTLLFINTRDGAEILASRFREWIKDIEIDVHHGSLSKISRIQSEDNFKSGKLKSLICTSSLELGIDIGNTDFVIQYNSPREVKRILQRVGRSGHKIGKTSKGLIIATNPEDFCESLVIAKKALNGEIEKTDIRINPLSVLANQIISIVLEYGKIKSEKIFEIIKRSYVFYNLKKDLFYKILDQLKNQRSIWIGEDDYIIKRRNSRSYFLENISMIPDEKSFIAIDISTRKKIGKLDESFILNYGFEGAKFILSGRPWTIVKREEENILVTQSKEIGTVPAWTGEDIPVPFDVAQEVGRLRRAISYGVKIKNYPSDKRYFKTIYQLISNQKNQGFVVPDDKTITIEIDEKTIIINACFGTKVNETLGRIISAMLAQILGESVGINSDPYRISLELPCRYPVEKIKDILFSIKPKSIEYLLDIILKNSTYIRWQLVHVARKFGAIKKDFDYRNVGSKKLFRLFENSLILDESIDKIIWEKMDIINTEEIIKKIHNGEIKIKIQHVSPIGLAGFETIRGLMAPKRADRSILIALKNRLEEAKITLVCTNCSNCWNTTVRRIKNNPKCLKCDAIKIAVIRNYNRNLAKSLFKKQRSKEEKKEAIKLNKNASLVLSYGKYAVLALVARGIGPDTAARILRKYNINQLQKSEELQINFLRDILKAELTYARTRGFWDNN